MKRVSAIGAEFQHAAIEADIWINVGLEIEVMPECQPRAAAFKKREEHRVEPLVAYDIGVINERGIGRRIRRRAGQAAVRGDPERRRSQRVCC